MDAQILSQFAGKDVKVVFRDGFALYGHIVEVCGGAFIFRTGQGTSAVNSDDVRIILKREGPL
ncbi:MAG: hypothetical protein ACP5FL_05335 [Thermoplasmatota archaeon]